MKQVTLLLLVLIALTAAGPVTPSNTFPGKGLAGYATTAQLDEMGADWFHTWQLCRPEWDSRCVHHVKSSYGMAEKGDTPQMLREALESCQNGWILFGDEWQLQGWPMGRQIAELYWFLAIRDMINPACKVAFGGELAYIPNRSDIGPPWVHAFWAAYRAEYGQAPDVEGVMINAYDFSRYGKDYRESVVEMVAALHDEAGDVPIWAREVGSLVSHQAALDSIPKLKLLPIDHMAFFISNYEPMWGYTALYGQDGAITDLGLAYQALPTVLDYHYVFLPIVTKGGN